MVRVDMVARDFHIHDPLWHTLDKRARDDISRSLNPLFYFFPVLLRTTGYWSDQKLGLKETDGLFKWSVAPKKSIFESTRPNCSGALACMTVERLISGCPSIRWGRREISSYRQLAACRIFSFVKDANTI